MLSATTSQTGVTVNVTSSVVASQEPSAAIVYRILTVVFVLILAGVYVEPVILPPPDTMLQEPPGGFPVNVLVCPSVIEAVVVVLSATTSQTGVTVNVTSSVVASQEPSAAIVYRILTVVFVLILAGVYVEPVILPPPETIDQEPPGGFPVNVLVCPSVIEAVVVVLSAAVQIGVTKNVRSLIVPAKVYLILTFVFVLMLAGVYVEPLMLPPPETTLQDPPEGVAINVFVCNSVMVAFVVVLSQTGVTVNVTSSVVAGQEPSAAIVYLILMLLFAVMLADEYVELEIEPPPDTMLQEPPGGSSLLSFLFVLLLLRQSVDVVLSASTSQTVGVYRSTT